MIPFSKYFCRNGYTRRIGIIVTIDTVYLITFMFICCCIAALAAVVLFIMLSRLLDELRYTYSLCCKV